MERENLELLRARILGAGAQALSDCELLALLVGTSRPTASVMAMAERLLQVGGGLKALTQQDPHELCAHPGMSKAKASQLLAALELGRRAQQATERRPRLRTPAEIYRYLSPLLSQLRREVFHVLCFNGRNVLLRDARVAEGTMNACPVDPREVFHVAIGARATAIVLAHNHPSGDAAPSPQDLSLTRQLSLGARLLGLRVLDHLVLGDGGYTSFLEQGLLIPEGGEVPRWHAAVARSLANR